MEAKLHYRHRVVTDNDLVFIHQLIAEHPAASRRELSKLCQAWNWVQPSTTGRGNNAPTRKPTLPIKEVLGYPMRKDFRQRLAEVANG